MILTPLYTGVHSDWHDLLSTALLARDPAYVNNIYNTNIYYLPNITRIFAAFSQPISTIQYVLLGESPYPRVESANGYAFWDNAIQALWSATGFSTTVNRATSLRNWLKALLVASGDLTTDTSQAMIARLDKHVYYTTASEFFSGMIDQGFLLLNAALIYRPKQIQFDAKQWKPFLITILRALLLLQPSVKLILFGRIAAQLADDSLPCILKCEHPYNISFISNPDVLQFFKPFNLLRRYENGVVR